MIKKGFTLVELIVVMAIIGIIATIFIPGIVSYFDGSKDSTNVVEYPQSDPVEKLKIVEKSNNLKCIDGKKVIELNGEEFYLGKIKNSWGDLEGVNCQ